MSAFVDRTTWRVRSQFSGHITETKKSRPSMSRIRSNALRTKIKLWLLLMHLTSIKPPSLSLSTLQNQQLKGLLCLLPNCLLQWSMELVLEFTATRFVMIPIWRWIQLSYLAQNWRVQWPFASSFVFTAWQCKWQQKRSFSRFPRYSIHGRNWSFWLCEGDILDSWSHT